jgi:hypothetical protein
MKTIVISLSLLLLLLACGKLPEDPARKPMLPGVSATPASSSQRGDAEGLFGNRSAGVQRQSLRSL